MKLTDVLVLVGLAAITAITLFLARKKYPNKRAIAGFTVYGSRINGEEDVITAIRDNIATSDFSETDMTGVEIEIIDATFVISPRSPTGELKDNKHMGGTTIGERAWLWQKRKLIARIAGFAPSGKKWDHAIDTSIGDEVVRHILAIRAGLGENIDHDNEKLNKLLAAIEKDVRAKRVRKS